MDDFDINGSYYVYSLNGERENLTPLMIMIDLGNVELVKFILESGADPNVVDTVIKQPILHYLLEQYLSSDGDFDILIKEMILLLLSYGADINILNNENKTPLHLASMSTSVSVVELLLEKGADIDAQDANGRTALMYASMVGDLNVIRKLLEYGADLTARNNKGKTVCEENTDANIQKLFEEF